MYKYIPPKRGLRVLGIAESFDKKSAVGKSVLAGVVMRADLQIDGFSFDLCSVGGLDATDATIRLYKRLGRRDVRAIITSGTVISMYNILDLHRIHEECGVPVIGVTYEYSEGLEKYLAELPDSEARMRIYKRNGTRILVRLKNKYLVYIRPIGISVGNAVEILNLYAIHGRYIEPLRVARILARSIYKFLFCNRILTNRRE